MIKPGRYRHYKGGIYKVLFTALDSATNSPVVVYLNELHGTLYTRPLSEFISNILTERGEDIGQPRFELLDDPS